MPVWGSRSHSSPGLLPPSLRATTRNGRRGRTASSELPTRPQLKKSRTMKVPAASAAARPLSPTLRDLEAATSVLRPGQRVALSRQRARVAFGAQVIELAPTFRTDPSARPALRLDYAAAPVHTSFVSTAALLAEASSASASASAASPSAAVHTAKATKKVSFDAAEKPSAASAACSCVALNADASASVADMASPVHAACARGDLLVLKHLLRFYVGGEGVDLVNSVCASCGRAPLDVAVAGGHARVVQLLLKRRADANGSGAVHASAERSRGHGLRHYRADAPVAVASRLQALDVLSLLLDAGAALDAGALIEAAGLGHTQVVRTLVAAADDRGKKAARRPLFKRGGDQSAPPAAAFSATTIQRASSAAVANHHAHMLPLLLGDGKSAASRAAVAACAFEAVALPDVRLVRALAKQFGPQPLVDARAAGGRGSLLHEAVKGESARCVKLLLAVGLDARTADANGITPLYLAAARGLADVVRLLLLQDASAALCTAMGPKGETPLHIAAQEGHADCVALLVDAGHADVDAATADGCTALHLASQRGNSDVVRLLLKRGADVHAETADGATALVKASRMSQLQTVKLLVEWSAHSGTSTASSSSHDEAGQHCSPERDSNIFIAKSNTHTSLGKWIRSVLKSN